MILNDSIYRDFIVTQWDLMGSHGIYPLVNVYIAMERSTVLKQGKTHYEYMAISNSKLLNLQRVRVLSRRTPYHGGLFLAMAMGSH